MRGFFRLGIGTRAPPGSFRGKVALRERESLAKQLRWDNAVACPQGGTPVASTDATTDPTADDARRRPAEAPAERRRP